MTEDYSGAVSSHTPSQPQLLVFLYARISDSIPFSLLACADFLSIEEECASTYLDLGVDSAEIEYEELLWALDEIEAPLNLTLPSNPLTPTPIGEKQSTKRQLMDEAADLASRMWYVSTLYIYLELPHSLFTAPSPSCRYVRPAVGILIAQCTLLM